MRRRLPWCAVLLLAPLLLGATDPSGDFVACRGGSPVIAQAPIDIVKASGTTAESGLALRFRITFSAPLPVPDEEGKPLRVDVLLLDDTVPDVSVEYYRGLNRIVRFDAVTDSGLEILLLPERSATPFTGGVEVDGDTLTLSLPARMVMPDPDLGGFDFGTLLWSVVARDGDTCDVLGGRARPTRRVKVVDEAASPVPPLSPGASSTAGSGGPLVSGAFLIACIVSIGIGGSAGFAAARWRRRAG
jgi:hypothetical protein